MTSRLPVRQEREREITTIICMERNMHLNFKVIVDKTQNAQLSLVLCLC